MVRIKNSFMDIRYQQSPEEVRRMDTQALRDNFLISGIMSKDEIIWIYTHYDRAMVGGVMPVHAPVHLTAPSELKADTFLARREMGVINVSGAGKVVADGKEYLMEKLDCLYLGKDTVSVSFESTDPNDPARFYLMSAPAHHAYPSQLMRQQDAMPTPMGDVLNSNKRVIYKYIHPGGIRSCQLVLGLTILEPGCVWNSFPPHTHDRRMEVYFYFDVPDGQRVFHIMGQPAETRHIVVGNHEAVVSPPWGMHFGCGTSGYGFIWGMAGENQEFSDMDHVHIDDLK
jgi:4-deoxy-L-threo-5-hexosulose-uronate ketol-isomerase